MIYIIQLGYAELGQGDDLKSAIEDAQDSYPDLDEDEVMQYREIDPSVHLDGDVVWTDKIIDI